MIENEATGLPVATTIEYAFSFLRRAKGLLFRTGIKPGHALVFDHTYSIHMFGMVFSIDVVFLDHEKVITALFPGRRPFSFPVMSWGAHYCIEMATGSIAAAGLKVGDRLSWPDPS